MNGIFLFALMAVSVSMQSIVVDTRLPQLKTNSYDHRSDLLVNVTVGENFAIGIPQFDIQKVPEDLKVYEITQQKFINMFKTMQRHQNSENGNQTRKQVQNDMFQCAIKSPSMQIIKTLSFHVLKPDNNFVFTSQQSMIYVPIGNRQLLYTFDTANMELSVYHYTTQKLNFLSSAKVSTKNDKRIAMAGSSTQQKVYLFSNEGMWAIQTKTVLTNIEKLQYGLNGFRTTQYPLEKLYHGSYGYIFGLKRYQAVYLIPQQSNFDPKVHIINRYKDRNLVPQDLYIYARMVYILDLHQGVFIFKILGTGKIQQYDHISWQTYGNLKLVVRQSSVFIKYMSQQSQNIVQLSYNSQQHEAKLVRYYKNDQIINKMSCLTVPVYMSHQSYAINQPLLFLVTDSSEIEVYPYNVDPRIINVAHNGVKMYVEGAYEIIYLFEDLYLIATQHNLLYIRLKIQKPQLQCKMSHSTGHIYYLLQFSTNIPSCEGYSPNLPHKQTYNENCKLVTTYPIYIDDPDLSRFQKGILYGVVFMVVSLFVLGLMCLIQWRNNQLSLIGRIKEEIVKLRDRYRKMQPFVQEEQEGRNKDQVVEFQLPEALPIPNTNADMHE